MREIKKTIRFLVSIVVFLAVLATTAITTKAVDNQAAYEARKGVVRIIAFYENGLISTGSGFGVGKAGEETDIFVTNWHVVMGENGSLSEVYIILDDNAISFCQTMENGEVKTGITSCDMSGLLPCEVLDTTDGYPDVAIIKATKKIEDHIALPLMKAEKAAVSDQVFAIGFPGDGDYYTIDDAGNGTFKAGVDSVISTDGTISRFTTLAQADNNAVIQHTAEINHGNSGGPLVTSDGAVIGINTYGISASDYATSIYIDYAMNMLDGLGIQYDTYNERFHLELWMIVIIVVFVLVLIVIILLVLAMKKKDRQHEAQIKEIVDEINDIKKKEPQKTVLRHRQSRQVSDSGFRLNGVSGVYNGRRFLVGHKVKIGRASDNDLIFPNNTAGVSGHHCELHVTEGKMYLIDMNSSHGVYVNGNNRIPVGKAVLLKCGDMVYLGSQHQCFRIDHKKGTGGKSGINEIFRPF